MSRERTASKNFFIVGCPRSGTTLLSVLLDRHPQLCVTPETSFYDEVAPRLRWPGRRRVRKVLSGWRRLPELGLDAERVASALPRWPWRQGEVLAALLWLYAQERRKARAGEKTPQHLLHVPRLLHDFPGARVLCMLRDGRDAALSLNAMPWMQAVSLRDAAHQWSFYARRTEQLSRRYPDQFHVVRYEELVREPAAALRTIMPLLGERFEPVQLDVTVASGVVLRRSMEWKGRALQPVAPDAPGERQRAASSHDLSLLQELLREDLRRLGYC
jgi:hypothetical protein